MNCRDADAAHGRMPLTQPASPREGGRIPEDIAARAPVAGERKDVMTDPADTDFSGPGPAAIYRDNLAAGKFTIQICATCGGKAVFPPRALCPSCGGTALRWQDASGAGTVYATTVVRDRPENGGDRNIALIDLAEGARLMSRVEGLSPEQVRIGMQVTARIARTDAGPLLVFDPA
jgi:uncharacterized OB-fold protein